METLRTFIAIKLPEAAINKLVRVQQNLQQDGFKASFTAAANIHLTLRFLGEVPLPGVKAIKDALDHTTANHEAFSLLVKGLHVLPDNKKPRILCAGLDGELESLQKLAALVAGKVMPWSFPAEKRLFHPHLTLARNPEPFEDMEKMLNNMVFDEEISFRATGVSFYKSVLTPRGPIYSVLHQSPLKPAAS